MKFILIVSFVVATIAGCAPARSPEAAAAADCEQRNDAAKRITGCGIFLNSSDLPDDQRVSALIKRAVGYRDLAAYDEAIADLDAAARLEPENPYVWNQKGNVYVSLEEGERALSSYRKATELAPDVDGFTVNVGIGLLMTGDAQGALDIFNAHLAKDPNDLAYEINRGQAFHDLGRYREAIAAYDRVLARSPNSADVKNLKAKSESKQGG